MSSLELSADAGTASANRAGVYLAKADVSPETLRRAVRQLLEQPRFQGDAARIGRTLIAAGGTAKAATLVRAFVDRAAPSRPQNDTTEDTEEEQQ